MRKLTELYSLLDEYVKDAPDDRYTGICHMISEMECLGTITFTEWKILKNHLYKNRPTEWRHIEFIADCSYDGEAVFWWPKGELCQRKLFIKKMIQVSKPWYKQIAYLWKQLRSIEKL